MTLTLAQSLESLAAHHWDLYKDAHGVRPRGIDTSNWTVEVFEAAIAIFVVLGLVLRPWHHKDQWEESDHPSHFVERCRQSALL